jgi:hypothetical protein
MNLTTRLAKLEKHQPQIDQEQRQKMIASIEQWLVELEVKAETDPDTRLYLEALRGMLAEKRSAPRANLQEPSRASSLNAVHSRPRRWTLRQSQRQ